MIYRAVGHLSGGAASWMACKRWAAKHGTEGMILLFADTKSEDEDTYRFLPQAAANIGAPLVCLSDGRTIWEVFEKERFLGNSRVDPCSKILKRKLLDETRHQLFGEEPITLVIGITWEETHRLVAIRDRLAPDIVTAPLCDPPYLTKTACENWARAEGIEPPRLYELGFAHNNCGGFCIKQGQAGFANLLRRFPDRYAYHEGKEEELRTYLGKDVAIMKDRAGGETKPLTMRAFRERLQRHRIFETPFLILSTPCIHNGLVLGVYGDIRRSRRSGMLRGTKASWVEAQELMGIDWMTPEELTEAIPPAYTEYIGRRLIEVLPS